MPASETGTGPAALAGFRRLVNITIVATLALIVIGGIVRVSDSGLGCGPAGSGTHGWPLCTGEALPFAGGISGETAIEFTHRLAAGIVGVLALLLLWRAWTRLREHRFIVGTSAFALVLVLAQAVLGGVTVEENLDKVLVASHLGLAMIFLATLLALSHAASPLRAGSAPAPEDSPLARSTPGLRSLALLAAVLVLATIIAGGYVAGTEGHGTLDQPVAGAHTACGTEFPLCGNGELFPFGRDPLVDAQLTHRLLMYLAAFAVLALVATALRRGIRHWAFPAALGILLAQILLGAINVWAGKHAGLIVGHLALGTTLWAVVSWAGLHLVPARSHSESTAPRGEALPA